MGHDRSRRSPRRGEGVTVRDPRASVPRSLGYLRPYRLPVAVILVCLVASAVLISIPPLLVRELIDVAVPEGDRGLLNLLVIGMIVLYVGSGLIGVLQNHLNTYVSQRIMYDIRNQLYEHLQGLSLRFFTTSHTGEVLSLIHI